MAITTAVAAVASLGFAAYSTVKQNSEAKKSRNLQAQALNEEREARETQLKRDEEAARRSRRQEIRAERIRRAQIVNTSEQTGTSQTSGFSGALGSLSSQLNSSLGFSGQQSAFNRSISTSLQNATNFNFAASQKQDSAGFYGNLAGTSFNVFNSLGGFGKIEEGYNKAFG